jgi:hypothetical protein
MSIPKKYLADGNQFLGEKASQDEMGTPLIPDSL